jgi:hypothetical protein
MNMDMNEAYFQDMLKTCRAQCQELAQEHVPQRDAIIEVLQACVDARDHAKDLKNQMGALDKKKASEEEKEPLQKQIEQATKNIETVSKQAISFIRPILNANLPLHKSKDSKDALMKCAVLHQAGCKNLATFCAQDPANASLLQELLLTNHNLLRDFMVHGGATKGQYGNAMKIFKQLLPLIPDDKFQECHTRLALAVALEHANPIAEFDTPDVFVNPVERFQHYQRAHTQGELDPCFSYLSTWELRWVVDSNATNEQLQWGRHQLKRYRPNQVVMSGGRFRYCKQVKSDVGYRQPNWTSKPRSYQQMLSGGGKCGPRAWFGRYICKAFGAPTWGVRQPGHAAMSKWTPNGWETVLGAGWLYSHWEGRNGIDFMNEAHARSWATLDQTYRKITLLECMGDACSEPPGSVGHEYSPKHLWRSLSAIQRKLWTNAATVDHFARDGSRQGDVVLLETQIETYLKRQDKPQEDNQIQVWEDGRLQIPACAFVTNTKCDVEKSFEGGGQIMMHNPDHSVTYKLPDSVSTQGLSYELKWRVCNVHLDQKPLTVKISNGKNQEQEHVITVPYTIGEWGWTTPIIIDDCGPGSELTFFRKDKGFGLTLKEFTLTRHAKNQ